MIRQTVVALALSAGMSQAATVWQFTIQPASYDPIQTLQGVDLDKNGGITLNELLTGVSFGSTGPSGIYGYYTDVQLTDFSVEVGGTLFTADATAIYVSCPFGTLFDCPADDPHSQVTMEPTTIFGYGYVSNWIAVGTIGAVPLPAGAPLLASSLAALFMRKRRQEG